MLLCISLLLAGSLLESHEHEENIEFTLIKMVSNRINDIFSLYYNISLILEFRPGMRGILIISSTRVLRSTRYKQYLPNFIVRECLNLSKKSMFREFVSF